ncbi:MAG: archease [Candidatus Abyssobacteria bacterium SURF_17]|uniref:Protein archease n=1 Tax=Candidatus Abyssobacteria bacterium SURF_17 TaxID=2093361 RepID=A0A419F0G3_9BACT|nr:MAG: archease [Candidatus Abyssubacteria bacterium SURF_17]
MKPVARAIVDARQIRSRYEIIEHTADIGIRVRAKNPEELFALAACAMFDLMVDISKVKPEKKAEVSLKADGFEELLVTWLNELVFRADVTGMFFSRFEVDSVTETSVEGSVMGEPYDAQVHSIGENVKAATYYQLEVSRTDDGWQAKVIFDV